MNRFQHPRQGHAIRRLWVALAAAGLLVIASSCRQKAPEAASEPDILFPQTGAGEFSVMTFNLNHYALMPRQEGEEMLEPKPREEASIVIDVIRLVQPDVLAVQEMGDPFAWAEFKYALRNAGMEYTHEEYLRRGKNDLNIAVLSTYPIVAHNSHVDDKYTISPAQFPVLRGFIEVDIEITPDYRFRLMVAHLKSKVFHSFGQAEMRRNEARLLGNHVRASLKDNEHINLVVVGDMNDDPTSAPIREITSYRRKRHLHDLRPVDFVGDAWTHRQEHDVYSRLDYIFVSDGMLPEVVLDKTYAVRHPDLIYASDHRPLVATFRASDAPPEIIPDLETNLPPVMLQND